MQALVIGQPSPVLGTRKGADKKTHKVWVGGNREGQMIKKEMASALQRTKAGMW